MASVSGAACRGGTTSAVSPSFATSGMPPMPVLTHGRAPRLGALAGPEALRVHAGRDRIDAQGGKAVALDEVALQELPGGDDARGGARVEPARDCVARYRRAAVARVDHREGPAHHQKRE